MRILGGEAKGRVLQTPQGKGTRPTDARAREMLFNILRAEVVNTRLLDLYAGTGAVGLEALSLGAAHCVFVEQNAAAVRSIKANLKMLQWQQRAEVWHAEARPTLTRLLEMQRRFDLIFADPPFHNEHEFQELCSRLDNASLLLHNEAVPGEAGPSHGLLVLQHHRKSRPRLEMNFDLRDERRAGESVLSFFSPRAASDAGSA